MLSAVGVIFLLIAVKASHFRGGIITVEPIDSENQKVTVAFQVAYRKDHIYAGKCDSETVTSGHEIGTHPQDQGIFCVEGCPETELVSLIRYVCTSFSEIEQWERGEGKANYTFVNATNIKLSAIGCCWVSPFGSADWDLFIRINLTIRTDTGKINSSPQARFFPVIKIPSGCESTISIRPHDPDGDTVLCRWGVTGECGGTCDGFPGAILEGTTCTITYAAPEDDSGFKLAVIIMEDFLPEDTDGNFALSTVALNFLVEVISTDSDCFSGIPQYLYPTPFDLACIAIPPNSGFEAQILVDPGDSGDILEITTVNPVGLIKSEVQSNAEGLFYVNLTWTPTSDIYGRIESLCFIATSSTEIASEERCTQLMPGVIPPNVLQGTYLPNNALIHPVGPHFTIQFDQAVQKSSFTRHVRFFMEENGNEVYSIAINSNSGINLVESLSNDTIRIRTIHRFAEKMTFYIVLEAGFAKGLQGCGPDSEYFGLNKEWTFTTEDITPPILTFLNAPLRSGENVTLSWVINEPVMNAECKLYQQGSDAVIQSSTCLGNHWSFLVLSEGLHRIEITVTDESDNVNAFNHELYIDRTAPEVEITSFQNTNSDTQVTINFHCLDYWPCALTCIFDGEESDCSDGTYITSTELVEGMQYTLFVYATDDVGNVGKNTNFTWKGDFTKPTIAVLGNTMAPCNALSQVQYPNVTDNIDPEPTVSYTDDGDISDCQIIRTWRVEDEAGNFQTMQQNIDLTFEHEITFSPTLLIPCDPMEVLQVPDNTANINNVCGRQIFLNFSDSATDLPCPGQLIRVWKAYDSCSQNVEQVTEIQNITFYSICPPSACNRDEDPPQGICVEGSCVCNSTWEGNDCEVLIMIPVIESSIPNKVLRVGELYEENPELVQGSEPIYWAVEIELPSININPDTGVVQWYADQVGHFTIVISARNRVGTAYFAWNITVMPAYMTFLGPVSPNIYTSSNPIHIDGHVEFIAGNETSNVPVHVLVIVSNTTRMYEVYTDEANTFSLIFEPLPGESGKYEALSMHPGAPPNQEPEEWVILSMKFLDPVVEVSGKVDGNVELYFKDITSLTNDGPLGLDNIEVSLLGVIPDVDVSVLLDEKSMLSHLDPGESVGVSINITSPQPYGILRIHVTVQSDEGVRAILILNTRIVNILPNLVTSPDQIRVEVVRGGQRHVNINITNNGEAMASDAKAFIPSAAFLSVVSFGDSSYATDGQQILPGDSIVLVLSVSPSEGLDLGRYAGSIGVSSDEGISVNVPITIIVISNAVANVTFRVEDEYSYFAVGRPLVNNSRIRINSFNRGISLTNTTEHDNGYVTFKDIPEAIYEVFIDAPRHESIKNVYTFQSGANSFVVFLRRSTVSFSWSVTPTQIQDEYIISVEADFETRVPVPVLTITPIIIDLLPLELEQVTSITYNVTNHGLIRAENLQLTLPTNHPFLIFEFLSGDYFGALEARSWIIIPVHVRKRQRAKRQNNCISGICYYDYVCGDMTVAQIVSLNFGNRYSGNCGWQPIGLVGGGGGAGGILRRPIRSRPSTIPCNLCLDEYLDCILSFIPVKGLVLPPVSLIRKAYALTENPQPTFGDIREIAAGYTEFAAQALITAALQIAFPIPSIFFNVANCLLSIANCHASGGSGRKKREVREAIIAEYIEAFKPFGSMLEMKKELFGNDIWLGVDESEWMNTQFLQVTSDNSDLGQGISQNEAFTLTNSSLPSVITEQIISDFVVRWNNSIFGWRNGKLEPDEEEPNRISYSKTGQIKAELARQIKAAIDAGYADIEERYNDKVRSINEVDLFNEEEGVCAVVRIRIDQELTLTREAFLARLEIDNGDITALNNIDVNLTIRFRSSGESAYELFAIGNASRGGELMSDRSLEAGKSGELTWFIVPYSEAAPDEEVLFEVGGTLLYEMDATMVNIPLLPEVIRVQPDPKLLIHYFWEKFVESDDPFTETVEPAIPFILAAAVKNAGNGTAHNLRITSSQPEIIENERGLLISFKLIGASIGNMNITPSLSVDFGDILPNQTVVARWFMVSSLNGKFQNYSASFQNNNPLGDPRLSLIDELEIHELIHEVTLTGIDDEEDDVNDFLVNEKIDYNIYPDAVFSSLTLNRYDVTLGEITDLQVAYDTNGKLLVKGSVVSIQDGFFYIRAELPISESEKVSLSSDSFMKEINGTSQALPKNNAWITTVIGERKSDFLIFHLFDTTSVVSRASQNITYSVNFNPDFTSGTIILRTTEETANSTIEREELTTTVEPRPTSDSSSGTDAETTTDVTQDPISGSSSVSVSSSSTDSTLDRSAQEINIYTYASLTLIAIFAVVGATYVISYYKNVRMAQQHPLNADIWKLNQPITMMPLNQEPYPYNVRFVKAFS